MGNQPGLRVILFGLVSALCLARFAHAQEDAAADLSELSLESLMEISVTSVSKKAEELGNAAAAVYVITAEDIRRSGATTIADALRGVPGISVANALTNRWAISARGFNDVFANKLLVLIDGRSVYTPLFAGTFWEFQDVVLEDVARIEVIRGPGGTLWGANAVNGVINIITKPAAETQGGLITAGVGKEERGFLTLRFGDQWSERTHFRAYAKFHQHDGANFPDGSDSEDDWTRKQIGWRIDSDIDEMDSLTFQGDISFLNLKQTYDLQRRYPPWMIRRNSDGDMDGANLLARWTRTFSDVSDFQLQVYYDITDRVDDTFDERRHNADIDFQHRIALGNRHDIVWGAGFRYSWDSLHNTFDIQLLPDHGASALYSAFIQDEIMLIEDTLQVTVGSKFEYNEFSGFEVQPNVRMAWTPNERHTLWGAVSRAVRTPSRAEEEVKLNSISLPLVVVGVQGNEAMEAEDVLAYELGYRLKATENLSFDLALFYNDYKKLRTVEIRFPRPVFRPFPHIFVPAEANNGMDATTYGAELVADWQPLDWWHLRGTYSYIEIDADLNPASIDILSKALAENTTPEQQFYISSQIDLPRNVEFDVSLGYVDRLSPFGLPPRGVDDYFDLDVRLGWSPTENVTLDVVAHDLLEPSRPEFGRTFVNFVPTEKERGVFGRVSWRF